ncbi:MAG: ccsA 1, partial [Nocardioides sp.]|nr:ccsA 1 [Nocardioides sp.]
MTDAAWETLSNQAVAACGVVYFLALLAHLVEWSALRHVPVGAEATAATTPGSVAVATGGRDPATVAEATRRTALFGRLGLLLTGIACAAHAVG